MNKDDTKLFKENYLKYLELNPIYEECERNTMRLLRYGGPGSVIEKMLVNENILEPPLNMIDPKLAPIRTGSGGSAGTQLMIKEIRLQWNEPDVIYLHVRATWYDAGDTDYYDDDYQNQVEQSYYFKLPKNLLISKDFESRFRAIANTYKKEWKAKRVIEIEKTIARLKLKLKECK